MLALRCVATSAAAHRADLILRRRSASQVGRRGGAVELLLFLTTTRCNPPWTSRCCTGGRSVTERECEDEDQRCGGGVRSPDLVDREYADLKLKEKLGHVVADFSSGLQKTHLNRKTTWVWKYGRNWLKGRSSGWRIWLLGTLSFDQVVTAYPGPLVLVSILCPDPYFKKRHHKRRVVQKPLVDSISRNLSPGGKVFLQSDVLEVALDMRDQFDATSDFFQHIDGVDPGVPCDADGWLLNNPMGIRTEREIHAEFEGARMYRRMYQKRDPSSASSLFMLSNVYSQARKNMKSCSDER